MGTRSKKAKRKYTKLSKTDIERFVDLIVSGDSQKGRPIAEAAEILGMSVRSAYNLKDRLISEGTIIAVGKSPALFERTDPPTGDAPEECKTHGGCATLDEDGIFIGKGEAPEGFARTHFSGTCIANVFCEGDTEVLRDAREITYGYWSKDVGHPNGCEERVCTFIHQGQTIKVTYRKGNRGSMTARFGLGEIWADPTSFETPKDVFSVFLKRVDFTISVLEAHGWRISKDIEFKGSLHMAWPGHSWGPALVNRVYDRTDSSVVADRSPGILEVEIENVSEQSGLDSAKVLAHAPEIILSHSNELTEHGLAIERAEAAIDSVSDDALERITHINTVLNGIIGTLSTVNTALLKSVDNEQLLLKNTVLSQQIMANQLGLSNPEFLPKSPEKGTFSPHLEGYQ